MAVLSPTPWAPSHQSCRGGPYQPVRKVKTAGATASGPRWKALRVRGWSGTEFNGLFVSVKSSEGASERTAWNLWSPAMNLFFNHFNIYSITPSMFFFLLLFLSSLTPGSKPSTPLHSLHSGEDVLASYIRSFYPAAPLWVPSMSSPDTQPETLSFKLTTYSVTRSQSLAAGGHPK